MKKMKFAIYDDINREERMIDYSESGGLLSFVWNDEKIELSCKRELFDFRKESSESILSITYKNGKIESSILLKSENIIFDIPITEFEYCYEKKHVLFKYKIDEDLIFHTIEITY